MSTEAPGGLEGPQKPISDQHVERKPDTKQDKVKKALKRSLSSIKPSDSSRSLKGRATKGEVKSQSQVSKELKDFRDYFMHKLLNPNFSHENVTDLNKVLEQIMKMPEYEGEENKEQLSQFSKEMKEIISVYEILIDVQTDINKKISNNDLADIESLLKNIVTVFENSSEESQQLVTNFIDQMEPKVEQNEEITDEDLETLLSKLDRFGENESQPSDEVQRGLDDAAKWLLNKMGKLFLAREKKVTYFERVLEAFYEFPKNIKPEDLDGYLDTLPKDVKHYLLNTEWGQNQETFLTKAVLTDKEEIKKVLIKHGAIELLSFTEVPAVSRLSERDAVRLQNLPPENKSPTVDEIYQEMEDAGEVGPIIGEEDPNAILDAMLEGTEETAITFDEIYEEIVGSDKEKTEDASFQSVVSLATIVEKVEQEAMQIKLQEKGKSLFGRIKSGLTQKLKSSGRVIQAVSKKIWSLLAGKFSDKEFDQLKANFVKRIKNTNKSIKQELIENPERMQKVFDKINEIKHAFASRSYLSQKQRKDIEPYISQLQFDAQVASLNYFESEVKNLEQGDSEEIKKLKEKVHSLDTLRWFKTNNPEINKRFEALKLHLSRKAYVPFSELIDDQSFMHVLPYFTSSVETVEGDLPETIQPPISEDQISMEHLLDTIDNTDPADINKLVEEFSDSLLIADVNNFRQLKVEELASKTAVGNLLESINRFKILSNKVVPQSILKKGSTPQQRAKVVSFYLQVAKRLEEKGDYNSSFAIYAGLNDSSILRLKLTENELSSSDKETKIFLDKLFHPDRNNKALMDAMKVAQKNPDVTVIPTIPSIIKQLTSVKEFESSFEFEEVGKLINPTFFQALVKVWEPIRDIQTKQSDLQEIESPIYIDYNMTISKEDKNNMYQTSLELEPRNQAPSTSTEKTIEKPYDPKKDKGKEKV